MKRPNKGGKRVVPQPSRPGPDEPFDPTIDAGPPIYHAPIPPAKSRGRLIPADEVQIIDVGPPMSPEEYRAYCEREHIPLPGRPLVPLSEEVAKLPRRAGFAFAARCARRVWPIARAALVRFPKDGEAVARALDLIETFANGQGEAKTVAKAGRNAMQAAANASANGAGSAAVDAMCATHLAADAVRDEPGGALLHSLAVDNAVKAITHAAIVETPIRRQLLCIRRDFDRLVYLAKKHNWTDDTPVPPEVFGPMWPKDLTPDWAKEPPAPNTSDTPPTPPA
jgi:hypothetical protein